MARHNELGRQGEEAACRLLEQKGYRILERNWRVPAGEIDLIAIDRHDVVFVEVKTRQEDTRFPAIEAVNRTKIQRIVAAAQCYVRHYKLRERARFDLVLVSVDRQTGGLRLEHLIGAFDPPRVGSYGKASSIRRR